MISARTIIPVAVLACLAAGAGLVEYGQYSSLLVQTASVDVAQLCGQLSNARVCPRELTFPTRAAIDPWKRPYQCRSNPQGLVLYTLGADNRRGGTGRDADLACATVARFSGKNDACSCQAGADASELLK